MEYFPDVISLDDNNHNITSQLYGHRIHESQTVGEYLLEFLLVYFGSEKTVDELLAGSIDKISYKINPKMGLKRFVFLENSKMINQFQIDKDANEAHNSLIKNKIVSEDVSVDVALDVIKDLFYGYSLVTRQRGWFAQSLLPLSKEMIFCEAMGKKSKRENNMHFFIDGKINKEVDSAFEFAQHNFMARGGEVYFLHMLQGFIELKNGNDRDHSEISNDIQTGLEDILSTLPQLEKLAQFIQTTWEQYLSTNIPEDNGLELTDKKKRKSLTLDCGYIKDSYKNESLNTMLEIRSLLKSDISTFEKLEILNVGIILQLFRLMTGEAYRVAHNKMEGRPIWLIHVPSKSIGDEKIKKLAVKHYSELENYMTNALSILIKEQKKYNSAENSDVIEKNETDELKILKNAYEDSHKLLRKIGKEIGFIIPSTGINMRLTFSDSIIKFLVVSLIFPSQKITLDRFMEKLYSHFGIVIREKEFTSFYNSQDSEINAPYLKYNYENFILQLKANGFLKELSDATAIVENPYNVVRGNL